MTQTDEPSPVEARLHSIARELRHEYPVTATSIAEGADEIARLLADNERLRGAISWALGEGDSNFGDNTPDNAPRYWWRTELRRRAWGE